MTGFVVVIPSRYASTRLPGKPLRDIEGKTMLQHVYERGMESSATDVVIATDDDRIVRVAEAFGARVCMTSDQHRSGSERIAEVCDVMDWEDDRIVVNLQGDEPTMPATLINQCAALLQDSSSDIATLASPIRSLEDLSNPNVVKVIVDDSGEAIYFSRAAIPFARSEEQEVAALDIALHHHGIYAYRCGVLRRLVAAEPSQLEIVEQLEQLRALSLGMSIRVGIPSERPGAGVDTEEDLITAAAELRD
jgi:3-deoxy-manno-octulosonate cytidylyltransferase (CMP-KDO synthetase)